MNSIRYKLLRWAGPTFEGSNDQFDVEMAAKAKSSPDNPYEVANEILALRLGIILGLPIPLGAALEDSGKLYYLSFHVAISEEELPVATDADIAAILSNQHLSCGILMFDSWILNQDRFRKNICYDDETKSTFIFDHGRALSTGQWDVLEKNKDSIGIGKHCLCDITSLAGFDEWHRKMLEIPERYIRESVDLAATVGLPKDRVTQVTDFLLDRRVRLRANFRSERRAVFSKIPRLIFDDLWEDFDDYRI